MNTWPEFKMHNKILLVGGTYICSQVGISKDAAIDSTCNYSCPEIAVNQHSCNIKDIQLVMEFNQCITLCEHGLSVP